MDELVRHLHWGDQLLTVCYVVGALLIGRYKVDEYVRDRLRKDIDDKRKMLEDKDRELSGFRGELEAARREIAAIGQREKQREELVIEIEREKYQEVLFSRRLVAFIREKGHVPPARERPEIERGF